MTARLLLTGLLFATIAPVLPAWGQDSADEELERVRRWVRTRQYDSIPSIDRPAFVGADSALLYLRPQDEVVGVFTRDVAKAYPVEFLNGREVVNDSLGHIPITVTW